MVLDTGEEESPFGGRGRDAFERRDVRDTATKGVLGLEFADATANQDLTNAGGWTDLTSMSVTFTLDEEQKVLIMGNVVAQPGDDIADPAVLIRLHDGAAISNTEREILLDMKVGANSVLCDGTTTKMTLSTFHVETLAAGSHTIKMQGRGGPDGTTYAARISNRSLAVVKI